jgi:hypothetical protein
MNPSDVIVTDYLKKFLNDVEKTKAETLDKFAYTIEKPYFTNRHWTTKTPTPKHGRFSKEKILQLKLDSRNGIPVSVGIVEDSNNQKFLIIILKNGNFINVIQPILTDNFDINDIPTEELFYMKYDDIVELAKQITAKQFEDTIKAQKVGKVIRRL